MVEKYCKTLYASIFQAMQKIDGSAIATVVVCEVGKVVGILTDGDIRRAIIGGASLTTPIAEYYTKKFISVGPDVLRADVLELMQARVIEQIPIVDENGELKGIHTMHSILGHSTKPNWAVIMAGGKGTRLGKLTENTPKPRLKVAGKPILERLILHLVSHGIRRVFLSVNYLSDVIKDHFGNGERFGCQIEYLHEDEPLGTAGSLSLLPEEFADPILVMNGDLVMNADLGAMLDYHERGGYLATIGVKTYSHQVPYGCVTIDGDCIVKIDEKPDLVQLVNAGIYVLSPAAVKTIPKAFYPITELFGSSIRDGLRIGAFDLDCDWVDIGMPDQLKQARGQNIF
ncbi:MAG: nucleotidyltransferase family protein [Spirochaetales bacterium]|jgi:dTDP-glucose pyrophosphorylase|nr:nucleotidyltransferase family protein [Spirochaetales bacterium]